jgi:glycosyltransferase involved in cell wall biosynthesis
MVSREPLVTVLMATRNGSRFLHEALRGVLSQDYNNFELLIIDDASIDNTGAVVAGVGDDRIRLIRNAERLGLTRSLNRGLGFARGEYIARIDDDDTWPGTDKLRRQVGFMLRHPRVGLVGTQNIVTDVRGRELYRWQVAVDDEPIRRAMLGQNQFVHSGVLIRRAALKQAGSYDAQRRFSQDYELWLRIGQYWQLANLPDVWVCQRVNPRGVTGKNNLRQFFSFIHAAWCYRHDYPGFWSRIPLYAGEFFVNLLPKPLFYRLSGIRRSVARRV